MALRDFSKEELLRIFSTYDLSHLFEEMLSHLPLQDKLTTIKSILYGLMMTERHTVEQIRSKCDEEMLKIHYEIMRQYGM